MDKPEAGEHRKFVHDAVAPLNELPDPLTGLGTVLLWLFLLVGFGLAIPLTVWLNGWVGWTTQLQIILFAPPVTACGLWAFAYKVCEKLGFELVKQGTDSTFPVNNDR